MRSVLLIVIAAAVAALTCSRDVDEPATFKVAFVADAGGVGDKARNDMVWRGCQRFVEEGGAPAAEVECYEPATVAEGRSYIEKACENGADAVVLGAPVWEKYASSVARRYKGVKFLIVGGAGGEGNVKSLSFPAAAAGYMMGVAAAAAVPAGDYAFIAAYPGVNAEALSAGFKAGVESGNPGALVKTAYVRDGFGAPAGGGAGGLATRMFNDGASVVFAAAGADNVDIASAAKDCDKLVIGFESNQNSLERGHVITSLVIRWDDIVYEELCLIARGGFRGGLRKICVDSELISYPVDASNRGLISAEAIKKIEEARQGLAACPSS